MLMSTNSGAAEGRSDRKPWRKSQRPAQGGPAAGGGAVYGLGMIGAVVYFLRSAASGADYILAFPRAVFWPALLVYKLFRSLDR